MTVTVNTAIKPKLAFLGTGWIGFNRMKSLLENNLCTAVSICDPVAENAARAKELAAGAEIHASLDEIIETKPDGIVIATPSALHYEQSLKALSSGIAVFCQKPLSRTAAESKKIIETAKNENKLLGVDLSYRFTEGMQRIFNLAQNNELGEIYSADLVFHNAYGPDKEWFYNPKLSGGGCLIDLGIHLVDLALWILNFPDVSSVNASFFSKGRRIEDLSETSEDFVSAQMETSSGAVIRLTCSWNLPAGKDAEIKAAFYGTKAAAVFSNTNGSFYDFETSLCHGTSSKIISSPPDDWGGKALTDWTKKLQVSDGFNQEISSYQQVAAVIDKLYGRNMQE